MKSRVLFLLLGAALTTVSCKKNYDESIVTPPIESSDSAIAPSSFDFTTTKTVSLNVKLATNNDEAIAGVPVRIYAGDPLTTSPVYAALSGIDGIVSGTITLPSYVDTVIIDPQYIGLMRNAKAYISNDAVNATIGGSNGFGGNVVESSSMIAAPGKVKAVATSNFGGSATVYAYMGASDSYGVPKYLEGKDVISSELLSYVNASLPESNPVPVAHPTYLQSGNTTDLNIGETADVWITFVSEGAGYLNTLGYFTYPTGSAPTKASDIDTIHYIFPNASLPYSGGNLASGSRVKLGRFEPGTSIGFVLLAYGWNGNGVNSSVTKYYSEPALNPETKASLKQHTVLLYDDKHKLFLSGFEDLNREGSSDNDFNDLVFYATSNPVTAISTADVQPVDQPGDADKDGITDKFDMYPKDPQRAFDNYYPSATTFGTLAFEDLWPSTGDYDMNDLVVGYRYKYVTNAQGNAVEMFGNYYVKAAGATFADGFGVQLPFSASLVKSVTGQKLSSGYIKQASSGLEASQNKAVIIPFDDYSSLVTKPGGFLVNTQSSASVVTSDTAKVYLSFTSPISVATLGAAPFNPFLISDKRRGYEVHLPGSLPTDLANTKLFSTAQDYTHPLNNYYYKSKNAWPWALSFAESFDYSSEGSAINKSYLHFLDWAQSGGMAYKDWYKNLAGYRNSSLIYKK